MPRDAACSRPTRSWPAFGNCGAVDDDERLPRAPAHRVHGFRRQLFAGAGLAFDEDGGITAGDGAQAIARAHEWVGGTQEGWNAQSSLSGVDA